LSELAHALQKVVESDDLNHYCVSGHYTGVGVLLRQHAIRCGQSRTADDVEACFLVLAADGNAQIYVTRALRLQKVQAIRSSAISCPLLVAVGTSRLRPTHLGSFRL
jgi:hypothetical protein